MKKQIKNKIFFIRHIFDSVKSIEDFSKGFSKSKFLKDRRTQNAIMRELEILREATKNLPIEFITKYPHVPWSGIAKNRDILAHHYFGVDLEKVWNVVKDEIPKLKKEIEIILKKEK